MHRRKAISLAGVSLFAACAGPSLPGPGLDGTWQPVSAILGGTELPIASFKGALLVLKDGAYQFGNDSGTFSLLPATEPAAMDIEGRQGPNAGRRIFAIYALQAETLAICYELGAGARPKEFGSPSGSHLFLVRYRLTR
jgi:uncharacterized protein (TIGR03067 family)